MNNLTYTTALLPNFPAARAVGHPMNEEAKALLAQLQATFGTEPQQTIVVTLHDLADNKAMARVQTRLNGLGRRGGFGVATRRDPTGAFNEGQPAVFAWAVPKRANKPRKPKV
jgi:hypothetical protein